MNKAVFLDRDGVINRTIYRDGAFRSPRCIEELAITENIEEVLYDFWRLGFLNIVVTNQPDVARGFMTEELLLYFHLLLKEKLPIDDISACIHDDKDNCNCRKPKSGLLLDAAFRYNIDLGQSYMIGDTWRDILAGKNVGCTTILVDYSYNRDIECDYRVFGVADASYIITELDRL